MSENYGSYHSNKNTGGIYTVFLEKQWSISKERVIHNSTFGILKLHITNTDNTRLCI